MHWTRAALTTGILFAVAGGPVVRPAPHLVVHEWGTVTTRHAPDGTPEGRLNRINPSEVLPPFVHQWEPPATREKPDESLGKTTYTPGRPDVTMRLETPVIYFHAPAAGSSSIPPFDVSVDFHGGIVNEFYPAAAASVALDNDRLNRKVELGVMPSWDGVVLDNYVVGSLRWTHLSLVDSGPVPKTASHVWTAPRHVRSGGVVTASGEGERFLFYRGVAHLEALVQTELSATEVRLRAPQRLHWLPGASMIVPRLWLVDIRAGGKVAYREYQPITMLKSGAGHELARLPLFAPADHSTESLGALRRSMKLALVTAGLFDDEAEAMLETWKESYFASRGLRILYLVPREWTDTFLPLRVSVPHDLTRVLVGRIDLLPR